MDLYKKVEKFVVDAFRKADKEHDVIHARRTAEWVKKLKPDADVALLIAGLAHDIERAFYGDWKKGSMNSEQLRKHQDLCATEIGKFLKKEKVEQKIIDRVKMLVAHHEEGGDGDLGVLCDADSLAYFQDKAVRNVRRFKEKDGREKTKAKLDHVIGRISSVKAREFAQKWYQEAIEELDKD